VNNSEQIRFQKRVNRRRSSPEPTACPYMPGREPLGMLFGVGLTHVTIVTSGGHTINC